MSEIREYCGLCGVTGLDREAVALVAEGLLAMQHRGQEAAGILCDYEEGMKLHKRNGTVTEAMSDLPADWSNPGIRAVMGHVRYCTYGGRDCRSIEAGQSQVSLEGRYARMCYRSWCR